MGPALLNAVLAAIGGSVTSGFSNFNQHFKFLISMPLTAPSRNGSQDGKSIAFDLVSTHRGNDDFRRLIRCLPVKNGCCRNTDKIYTICHRVLFYFAGLSGKGHYS